MKGTTSLTIGQTAEFASAVIRQLPWADLNPAEVQQLIENQSKLQQILRSAFLSDDLTRTTYPVTVDYGLSLEEMIAAGEYDWKNFNITADHFPVKGTDLVELEVRLVHFNRYIKSKEAIRELGRMNLRSATIEVLLAFADFENGFPEKQREFPIVALGSVWRDPDGNRSVPYLWGDSYERNLDLRWFESDWRSRCRFAAVRK